MSNFKDFVAGLLGCHGTVDPDLSGENYENACKPGGSGGGGGSMEPIVIFINDEPMTASVTFEEAWALSVPDLAARLTACGSHDDDGTEIGISVVAVQKSNTRTWGKHIIVLFDYIEAASDHVLVEPGYILWTEYGLQFASVGMP